MKVAVIGSRSLTAPDLAAYLPPETTEIISGGAKGIDACAREYALTHGLRLTEFLPEYNRYGRAAPLKRNEKIVAYADVILAFWDGSSHGTAHTLKEAERQKKKTVVIPAENRQSKDV